MEKIATENLFLLEFLVDNVALDPKCDCAMGEGERCVSFQFLDNAPLDVCEEDFTTSPKEQQNNSIKSGKSCLFSLTPEQAKAALKCFDIYVTIFKKMPAGWLPPKVEIGEALISISNLFTELINSVESSDGSTPTAKTLKDTFVINNSKGKKEIGKIGVYIRMSCFGKLIVTQFQMNLEDKSVLFKDKEGKSLYKYKKAGKGNKAKQETCSPKTPPVGNPMQYPGTSGGMIGANMNAAPCPVTPCMMVQPPGGKAYPFTPNMLDQALMGQPSGDPYGKLPPCQECGAIPDPPCFKMKCKGMRMGAEPSTGMGPGTGTGMGPGIRPGTATGMGPAIGPGTGTGMGPGMGMGRALTPCIECGNIPNPPCIHMQGKGMGIGMGMGPGMGMGTGIGMGMGSAMTPCIECGNIPNAPCLPPSGSSFPKQNVSNTPCVECAGLANPPCARSSDPEGNYQEIGASMGGNSLTIRVHKDKNKIEPIDTNASVITDDSNKKSGCCCVVGKVGKKDKKQDQRFDMRPGVQQGNQDMPFSFKMGKAGNTGNNVVVNPPVATAPDGTKFTEFSDPNKELFILRVGKKSEGMDKKQNLELELCTPRGKVI